MPVLDAAVKASVNVDLLITPEVNLGIKVAAPKISGDLLNAQIVGFVNNTFRFEVQAQGKGGAGATPAGTYGKQCFRDGYQACMSLTGYLRHLHQVHL